MSGIIRWKRRWKRAGWLGDCSPEAPTDPDMHRFRRFRFRFPGFRPVSGDTIPILVVWATQLFSDCSDLSHLAKISIVSPILSPIPPDSAIQGFYKGPKTDPEHTADQPRPYRETPSRFPGTRYLFWLFGQLSFSVTVRIYPILPKSVLCPPIRIVSPDFPCMPMRLVRYRVIAEPPTGKTLLKSAVFPSG